MPLVGGMPDAILQVLVHPSIHHVEEILPGRESSFGELIWEMAHKVRILVEDRP